MADIGKRNLLSIIRESAPGLYLDGGDLGEILLPRRYIPRDIAPKEKISVFLYRDSEDRLVATTETPLAEVGEFASLQVVSVNPKVGAFLDWGLPKDLLLPYREHDLPLRVGHRIVVCVVLDDKTDRIIASARLGRHLSKEAPGYRDGQQVDLLIASETELGYNAIIENAHRGLLYKDNLSNPLKIGQRIRGYVRTIRDGGKIDLSLDASGYQRVFSLTGKIIQTLERHNGHLAFDDDSSPESIRQTFGVSKKAFKQALGTLYKHRRIRFKNPGIELLDNSAWEPGEEEA